MRAGRGGRKAVWVGWALAAVSACDGPPCEQLEEHLEECNLQARVDFCGTEALACYAECLLPLSCSELLAPQTTEVTLCVISCTEHFVCDDDLKIPSSWRCDDEKDCLDGTDETHCN